jgi:predicted alpha/beta superfamily hydrolase
MQLQSLFSKMAINIFIFSLLFKPIEVFSQKITIKSEYLKQERTINVFLPEGYECSKATYPIVFVTDGSVLSNYIHGLFIYNWDIYPPVIIVGINQINRGKELVPQEDGKIHEKFSNFVNKELLPRIESDYRTNGLNILIGHSFGGYFSLVCMLENPKINYAISISPTIWGRYEKKVDLRLKEYSSVNQNKIYFGIAESDYSTLKKGVIKLNNFVKNNSELKIESNIEEYSNEDHNSSILIGARKGLDKIFENWPTVFPPEKWNEVSKKKDTSIFYNYFHNISKKTKKSIIPSEDDYNSLGYFYLKENKIIEAIKVFNKNAYLHPCSSNVYDSLGEAHEKNNDFKKALKSYEKALKIEKKNGRDKSLINQYLERIEELKKSTN